MPDEFDRRHRDSVVITYVIKITSNWIFIFFLNHCRQRLRDCAFNSCDNGINMLPSSFTKFRGTKSWNHFVNRRSFSFLNEWKGSHVKLKEAMKAYLTLLIGNGPLLMVISYSNSCAFQYMCTNIWICSW